MNDKQTILKTVVCHDPCNKIHPKIKGADPICFPIVEPGKEYNVLEIINKNEKLYYRFENFPDNHLFDVRGFRDKT